MEYTTLSNLKTYLGISGDAQNAALTSLITLCSEMLSLELGDDLGQKTVTRRVNWTGTYRIVLENNVSAVTSVHYTTDNGDNRTALTVDALEWAIVYTKEEIPRGERNIKVVYTKGYATVPKPLEEFFLKYVQLQKELREQITDDKKYTAKVKQIDGMSVEYFWPSEIAEKDAAFKANRKAILKKYKNFNMLVIN